MKPSPTGPSIVDRAQTETTVTCIECGHVGKMFVPIDLNAEWKEWGDTLIRAAYKLGREDERDGTPEGDIVESLRALAGTTETPR